MELHEIERQVAEALRFLCQQAHLQQGALVVLGCSTSEIGGGHIGKSGSLETGYAVIRGAQTACNDFGLDLAVQCCEHLNRALVLSGGAALSRGYRPVAAIPHTHAGGACATAAWRTFSDPVLVETIQADAGLDIGETLIGMHLRPVAVPLRPTFATIGQARLVMAFARPKYIGGPRAQYTLNSEA